MATDPVVPWKPPKGSVEVEPGFWRTRRGDVYCDPVVWEAMGAAQAERSKALAAEDRARKQREMPRLIEDLTERLFEAENRAFLAEQFFAAATQLINDQAAELECVEALLAAELAERLPLHLVSRAA